MEADVELSGDPGGQSQHGGVQDQQEESEGEDNEGAGDEGQNRLHDRIDDAEDQGGEQERREVVGGDPRDQPRGDSKSSCIDDEPDQKSNNDGETLPASSAPLDAT